jgi:hypothetical protein
MQSRTICGTGSCWRLHRSCSGTQNTCPAGGGGEGDGGAVKHSSVACSESARCSVVDAEVISLDPAISQENCLWRRALKGTVSADAVFTLVGASLSGLIIPDLDSEAASVSYTTDSSSSDGSVLGAGSETNSC